MAVRAAENRFALRLASVLLVLLVAPVDVLLAAGAPRADAEPAMVSFGVTDLRLHDGLDWPHGVALQFRFRPLRAYRLRPSLGIEAARDGETLVYVALERDFAAGPRWILTPGLGVGSFRDGAMVELGSSLQFRSALALSYRLQNQWRIGLAFSHLSNGGVAERNPGTEELSLTVSMPLARRSDRPPQRSAQSAAADPNNASSSSGAASVAGPPASNTTSQRPFVCLRHTELNVPQLTVVLPAGSVVSMR